MSFATAAFTIDPDIQWRFTLRAVDELHGGVLASGNGTSSFRKVKRGTVLGRLANNKVRPLLNTAVAAPVAGANAITVRTAANAYIGDVVNILRGAPAATAIVAGATPSNLTVTPRVPGISVDIVVGTVPKLLTHAYDAATGVIQFNGAVPATPVVFVAGDNPSNLTITPTKAFHLVLVNPGAAGDFSASEAAGVLTVNLAWAGAAVTTTVGQLGTWLVSNGYASAFTAETAADLCAALADTAIAFAGTVTTTTTGDVAGLLEGTYGGLIASAVAATPADLAVDVGPTALGLVAGGSVAASRTVTAVDKATNIITVDGGALTLVTGDVVRLAVGWLPAGVLDRAERTVVQVDGEDIAMDCSCNYSTEADAVPSKLTGYDALQALALGGGAFADLDGTTYAAPCRFALREI